MRTLFADLRYALRQLRRCPGFAITAILTLTMAIAYKRRRLRSHQRQSTIHPLPIPDSHGVYSIEVAAADTSFSYLDYQDIRDRNKTFTHIADCKFTLIDSRHRPPNRPSPMRFLEITSVCSALSPR